MLANMLFDAKVRGQKITIKYEKKLCSRKENLEQYENYPLKVELPSRSATGFKPKHFPIYYWLKNR